MKFNLMLFSSIFSALLINFSSPPVKSAENSGQAVAAPNEKDTVLTDGTKILSDGTVVSPNGTKRLPNGDVVLPDGTVLKPQ